MSPVRGRWVKVWMELYSYGAQRSVGDYLVTQRVGGDISEVDGVWCKMR